MMMETVVYAREYLFAKELYDKGELGRIQFLRGVAPAGHGRLARLLARAAADALRDALRQPVPGDSLGKHAESVVCHGSGRIREELIPKYNSPFAIETATFKIKDSDVVAEVTRSLFDTARQYRESFDVFGSKKSFEWQQVENEEPVIHRKGMPGAGDPRADEGAGLRQPPARGRSAASPSPRRSRTPSTCRSSRAAGHGGSHPHLVHAFLQAVLDRAAGDAGRGDERELDDGRHLRARVGDARRRAGGDPDVLSGSMRVHARTCVQRGGRE